MNLNKVFVISFIVLLMSSTESSMLFTLLMKLLMIKGALFMSMPMSIGAFVMGQGMGFFAGNMMGGYMMLRAANRYHNKEKTRWVSYSGWHGAPFHTDPYQKGYNSGKAISDVISLGKQKINVISSIFKPFIPTTTKKPVYGPPPPKYGPPKYKPPPPIYGAPPPPNYGYPYGAYSSPAHSAHPFPPSSTMSSINDIYQESPAALTYADYYPGRNRKTGFSSSLLNAIGGPSIEDMEQRFEKIRRVHESSGALPPVPVSPSGFYTSAFATPGQEFTGILTNEGSSESDKYLGDDEDFDDPMSTGSPSKATASVTAAPNEVLESYLEERLKAEAEKQKDMERKQEAQQLVQMLRKAYLKQLVDSLKEEEASDKQKASRRLDSTPSAFASLTSSIESLFGSRESRSLEQKQKDNEIDGASARSASQTTQNLIRDLLINEVFTSGKYDDTSNKEDRIDTAEVESITERVLSLTSSEREELIKGLDEIDQDQDQQEQVLAKPILFSGEIKISEDRATPSTISEEIMSTTPVINLPSSTENMVSKESDMEKDLSKEASYVIPMAMAMPAEWILMDSKTFDSEDMDPVSLRVRRHTSMRRNGEAATAAASAASASQSSGTKNSSPTTDEQKQIDGFVEDIRKFFTLLSALDQDQCLQKLVCDVHTNEKDISTLTQYEKNILTTFKLMKALMPENQEDSSTNYRLAAIIGETGQSMELCQQSYTSCQYSSNQIVELGTQPEEQPTAGLPFDLASLQPQVLATTPSVTSSTTTTTTPKPKVPAEQDAKLSSSTMRRNYVESNQYFMNNHKRRYPQQQQSYQYSEDQFRPQQQQKQYLRERLTPNASPPRRRQRPPQQQHSYMSRDDSEEFHRAPHSNRRHHGPPSHSSNFFNAGQFPDFFRSMWSHNDGQKRMRNTRQRQYRLPAEVMEEIGI